METTKDRPQKVRVVHAIGDETVEEPIRTKKASQVATKKVTTETTARKAPVSGQSGPPLELPFEKLNDKERQVVNLFTTEGARETVKLVDIASSCWPSEATPKANSWVRNSLRRLVRGGWVEKVERGVYRVTEKGRKRLQRAAD